MTTAERKAAEDWLNKQRLLECTAEDAKYAAEDHKKECLHWSTREQPHELYGLDTVCNWCGKCLKVKPDGRH